MGGDCDLGVTGRDDIDEMEGDSGTVGSGFLRYLLVAPSLSCVGFFVRLFLYLQLLNWSA